MSAALDLGLGIEITEADLGFGVVASDPANDVDPASYDRILVMFSGGKDSLWCLLYLVFVLGVPLEKIELWHHDVDGAEGSTLMDWPCTKGYCRAVAKAFKLPLAFSWLVGGFEREMLRQDTATAPTAFELPSGEVRFTGGAGKPNTRRKFPQTSADLSVRWCSARLKIDVAAAAIRNQDRFLGKRTLVVTGERGEESPARARYAPFEPHRADLRNGREPRHVDHWRPALHVTEREVWALIEERRVNPHPAYRLGWGRVSCAACIFGNPAQWASLRKVNPGQFARVAAHERDFGVTIHRKLTVVEQADKGEPHRMAAKDIQAALSTTFDEPVFLETWALPCGAFSDSCGPI